MSSIRITIELVDADFRKDYDVDPSEPLNQLVARVARDEGVPLRTRQGRPLAWTAEGPEWRGDKSGWTDFVRTQPLQPVADSMVARHGARSPLFELRIDIPGAREALHGAREQAKASEIERRLAEREAERDAEIQAEMAEAGVVISAPTGEFEQQPPPPPEPIQDPGAESRIRRRARPAEDDVLTVMDEPPKKKKKKKKAAPPPPERPPWLIPAIAGGGLLLVGLLIVVATSGGEPEPTPTPTPVVVKDVPIDMPMATPPPRPTAAPATPTPVPMKTFYSKGEVTRTGAKAAGAQLSSFAKPDVKLVYTVTGDGGHTVSLKGRFTVNVGPNGGSFNGASTRKISGATVAPQTKMQVHYDGAKVTIRVGRKRYGPWPAKESRGFPAWQFTLEPSVTMTNLRASSTAID